MDNSDRKRRFADFINPPNFEDLVWKRSKHMQKLRKERKYSNRLKLVKKHLEGIKQVSDVLAKEVEENTKENEEKISQMISQSDFQSGNNFTNCPIPLKEFNKELEIGIHELCDVANEYLKEREGIINISKEENTYLHHCLLSCLIRVYGAITTFMQMFTDSCLETPMVSAENCALIYQKVIFKIFIKFQSNEEYIECLPFCILYMCLTLLKKLNDVNLQSIKQILKENTWSEELTNQLSMVNSMVMLDYQFWNFQNESIAHKKLVEDVSKSIHPLYIEKWNYPYLELINHLCKEFQLPEDPDDHNAKENYENTLKFLTNVVEVYLCRYPGGSIDGFQILIKSLNPVFKQFLEYDLMNPIDMRIFGNALIIIRLLIKLVSDPSSTCRCILDEAEDLVDALICAYKNVDWINFDEDNEDIPSLDSKKVTLYLLSRFCKYESRNIQRARMLLTAGIPKSEAWEHVNKARVIDRLREEHLAINFKSESGFVILKSFIASAQMHLSPSRTYIFSTEPYKSSAGTDPWISESGILEEENYVQEDELEYDRVVNGGISVQGLWQGIVKAVGGEEEDGGEEEMYRVVIEVVQVVLERLLNNAPKFIRSVLLKTSLIRTAFDIAKSPVTDRKHSNRLKTDSLRFINSILKFSDSEQDILEMIGENGIEDLYIDHKLCNSEFIQELKCLESYFN
ncbi:unnamed protein product [Moneuplotes crassus]|uniref:Uncharacterized protein n=1 Tax=Euplotes crassus TaxID=5936 RepID=A0AAD1Y0U8_EUPCR|nr:unnamed protein product [Moneuplotes crassus]